MRVIKMVVESISPVQAGENKEIEVVVSISVQGKGGGSYWVALLDSENSEPQWLPRPQGFSFYSTRSYASLKEGCATGTYRVPVGKILFVGCNHGCALRHAKCVVKVKITEDFQGITKENWDGTRGVKIVISPVPK